MLLLFGGVYFAQASPDGRPQNQAAYPESEAAAAWRGLAASYVRKALEDQKLGKDPTLNARVDTVMAAVGAAVAAIDSRFANSSWGAILIEDFGHGAAAFPGETILVDAKFVRTLQLSDDELALIFSREADTVGAAIFLRPDMIRNGLRGCSTSWRNWRPARTGGPRTPTMLREYANRLLPA